METPETKSMLPFYLAFAFVCGFLLGGSLPREDAIIISRMILGGAIVVTALFGKRIERYAHSNQMSRWSAVRARGKWFFIVTQYLLLRGAVVFVLFFVPLLRSMSFSNSVLALSVTAGVVLISALTYFGIEEWNRNEQEFQIGLLKSAGEQLRIVRN